MFNTIKCMGLPVAEADKEKFHYSAPFDLKTGEPFSQGESPAGYDDLFANIRNTESCQMRLGSVFLYIIFCFQFPTFA